MPRHKTLNHRTIQARYIDCNSPDAGTDSCHGSGKICYLVVA